MDTTLKISGYEFQVDCFVVTDAEGKKSTTAKKDFVEKYKGTPRLDVDNTYNCIVELQKKLGLIDHPKSKKKKDESSENPTSEA